jgi:hypothetical protein
MTARGIEKMEHFEWMVEVEDHPDRFHPITLTEELLLKCGFEKDDGVQQDWSLVLEISGMRRIIFYKGDCTCLSIQQTNNPMIDFPSSVCTTVHQLQNLYFALTGEELNIEL